MSDRAKGACSVVASGGVALGAFEAGALSALQAAGAPAPEWLVGTSVGAINAAIFAGNALGLRIDRLRQFWMSAAADPWPLASFLFGPPPQSGLWRRAYNSANVLGSLLMGQPGMFRLRTPAWPLADPQAEDIPSLYDMGPLQERLGCLLDFDRLNSGAMRFSAVATDVVSGERVVFDTMAGDEITPAHLIASCAFIPLFPPVEVAGRLLGDGGFASNLALDLLLEQDVAEARGRVCFAIELFVRRGSRPRSASALLARAGDLAFGNQTDRFLEAYAREARLRASFAELAGLLPPKLRNESEIAAILAETGAGPRERDTTILRLGYRGTADEAGPGKLFDFSRATLTDRWEAGERAMHAALRRLGQPDAATWLAPGLALHDIETAPSWD